MFSIMISLTPLRAAPDRLHALWRLYAASRPRRGDALDSHGTTHPPEEINLR
jgi:hypothetical protein